MSIDKKDKWLSWAVELQSIAQAGLHYAKDKYDIDRFKRVRDIAAEMLTEPSGLPLEEVKNLFCADSGYPTPKVACRAAVIQDNKILLVRETSDGKWCMPGGWVETDKSVGENLVKEVWEEAGMRVEVERVVAVQEHRKHASSPNAIGICNVFALCRYVSGEFVPNLETDACGFFAMDELPPLSIERTNEEQIEMCFQAYADEHWKTILE